ncbi:MAG: putative lipid II flippase FtsW [Elusimicrobia bacterium CG06_land_8_20_14_3_00_38_11]|nr:MAG: putative lipid II flippase FtsW [Elusimicrobia bacterium CG06_land_8_20_14_3_00_38_11]
MRQPKFYNHWVLIIVLALVSIGLVMVLSASGGMADYRYGSPTKFYLNQAVSVIIGIFSMLFFSVFDYNKLKKFVVPLLIFTVLLLISVLFFGTIASGARRWLRFGTFGFQPSEIAKITVIIFLAWYIDKRTSKIKNFKEGLLKPLVIVGSIVFLIFLERDFGVPFLIFLLTIILLFVGGANYLYIIFASVAAVPVVVYVILKEPYRLKRITTFLNPWADPQGAGYQLVQSLIAMGSGGIFGTGLGKSVVKMLFLPDPHTDFIFPIIGEEFGFIGTMLILSLFIALFIFGIKIAVNAKDLFGQLLAFGITVMITLQALINMSVSVGVLPTKGLPLPFISFGGSSVLVMLTSVGILLNIGKQLRYEKD